MTKFLVAVALLAVLIVGGGVWFASVADYSQGYRVGKVIKLSNKGYVFKTWEGTLDFGYLQTDPQGGVATRIWDFSVAPGDVHCWSFQVFSAKVQESVPLPDGDSKGVAGVASRGNSKQQGQGKTSNRQSYSNEHEFPPKCKTRQRLAVSILRCICCRFGQIGWYPAANPAWHQRDADLSAGRTVAGKQSESRYYLYSDIECIASPMV